MLVDLSVPIRQGMPKIPFLPEVVVQPLRMRANGDPLEIREVRMATHVGTHLDAPAHRILGGTTIEQIPLETVCGTAVVIPVEGGAGQPVAVDAVERSGIRIERGDIVLLHTGWSRHYDQVEYHDNPYLSNELAAYLVEHGAKMVGIDAVTVDMPTPRRPPDFDYPVHQTLLGNGVLILENLTNLQEISGKRVNLWAFPLKIAGSDAAHVRVVAEVESGA